MNASAVADSLTRTFAGPPGRFLAEREGRKVWAFEPWTPATVLGHVEGRERIGFPFDPERLTFAAFDLDGKNHPEGHAWSLATALRIVRALADLGIPAMLEQSRSGTGFHVWILFDANGPSLTDARELAAALLRTLGLVDTFSEKEGVPGFYPHPLGPKRCGGVPYLPLFGATNGHTSGVLCDLESGEPFEDQLAALDGAQRVPAEVFAAALAALRELAPAPPKPERTKSRPASSAGRGYTGTTPYARKWFDDVDALARKSKGESPTRHAALFSVAASGGSHIAGDGLQQSDVEAALRQASEANGYIVDHGEQAFIHTMADGIAKGKLEPRSGDPPREATPNPPADALEEPAWIREELEGETEPEAAPTVEASEPETKPGPEPDDDTPALPESLWRLGFAEFRAAWGHTTESPDAFLWSAYLVSAASVLGRGPSLALGVEVRPCVYVANLGRSGGARKTTGQGKADRILANVDEGITTLHGIGSPEGLIEALADDSGQASRVLVNLGELSTLLRKGAQEATRGLAPLLCTLFDSPPSVSLPNRKKPLEARDPYLCIIGSTTPDWLRADLTVDDVRGGLAGRFCYFTGQPKAPLPLPPKPEARALLGAERILRDASKRTENPREYELTPEAAALFSAWYITERAHEYPTAILDTLAQRLHVFAWKAALIFAVLEGTETVTGEQMAAALAFADYQRATQGAIFGTFGKSLTQQTIDRVLAALEKHGPLSGRQIAQRVRHVETETVAKALSSCCRSGLIEQRKDGRKVVWALIGQRFGNGSGNASSKGKR